MWLEVLNHNSAVRHPPPAIAVAFSLCIGHMDIPDPEKGHIPLDVDGPHQHPGVATEHDEKELDNGSHAG